MDTDRTLRLTPWVTRLLALNGAIYVLLATVFFDPRYTAALQFDPNNFTARPWTGLTYLFVHNGILPFAINTLLLIAFGPSVERRLGSSRFAGYYVYCGIGAALFSLALAAFVPIDPFVGGSGGLYGVMLAFAMYWPEARLSLFPFPVSLNARMAFLGLVIADMVLGFLGRSDIAHVAYLGGALAGYGFIRLQILTTRRPPVRPTPVARRPVVTPMRVQETAAELRPAMPATEPRPEIGPDDVDRILDKIAQFGMESLTSQERKLLADVSEKKRREQA